jgi:hypothetical protein
MARKNNNIFPKNMEQEMLGGAASLKGGCTAPALTKKSVDFRRLCRQ